MRSDAFDPLEVARLNAYRLAAKLEKALKETEDLIVWIEAAQLQIFAQQLHSTSHHQRPALQVDESPWSPAGEDAGDHSGTGRTRPSLPETGGEPTR